MKTRIIIISLIVTILVIVACIFGFYNLSHKTNSVEIDGHPFRVELAIDPQARQKGLGGRDQLCPDCGMLFLFLQKGIYAFWMKDMRFNLDIIWISDGKIVYIAKDNSFQDLTPINPGVEADKVLEINADLADRYGFKVGDEVKNK